MPGPTSRPHNVVCEPSESPLAVASPPRQHPGDGEGEASEPATPDPRRQPVRARLSSPPEGGGAQGIVPIPGRDSDLEAFSHNPSDGSFAPLAYQPST